MGLQPPVLRHNFLVLFFFVALKWGIVFFFFFKYKNLKKKKKKKKKKKPIPRKRHARISYGLPDVRTRKRGTEIWTFHILKNS